ncbi:unknown [Clostridium sp. CAG:448]|nr:unknown [Clostridium sp. CAG:448]
MPMMPILPAKEVRNVRAFLVSRLFMDKDMAAKKDMEGFLGAFFFGICAATSAAVA